MPRLGVPFALVFLLSAASCTQPVPPEDLLWVPPDSAIDARSAYKDGSAYVGFTIAGPEPEELTTRLMQHFQQPVWHPRSTQWLNPGLATSFVGGWSHACACVFMTDDQGIIVSPNGTDEWTGEWEDKQGDVITYHLNAFHYDVSTRDYLRGHAEYVAARNIDDALKRLRKRRGR
jgi:hypothetical protein